MFLPQHVLVSAFHDFIIPIVTRVSYRKSCSKHNTTFIHFHITFIHSFNITFIHFHITFIHFHITFIHYIMAVVPS